MHGRMSIPWIEGVEEEKEVLVANGTYAVGSSFGAASWMHRRGRKPFLANHGRSVDGAMLKT